MCAGRQAFAWFFHGYAPGLIVTNRYRPSSSVSARPAPVKFGSSGAGWESCGWAYLPARVRLPDLDERVPHRPAVALEHAAVHDDPLALRLVRMLAREIVIELADPSLAQQRPRRLRQRSRQRHERAGGRAQDGGPVRGVEVGRIDHGVVVRTWSGPIGHVDTSVPPRDTGDVSPIQMEPSDGTGQTDRIERPNGGR